MTKGFARSSTSGGLHRNTSDCSEGPSRGGATADFLPPPVRWSGGIAVTTSPFEQRAVAPTIRHVLASSPPRPVWTLTALDLIGSAVCFGAAFAPVTMHHFVTQGVVCGALFAAVAIGLWLLHRHLGRFGLLIAALVGVGIVSALVDAALTAQGVISASFAYLWTTVYAASFFPRRQFYVLLAGTAAGSGVALSLSGLHRWEAFWVLVLVTAAATGTILERSVAQLRREAETDSLTGVLNRRGFFKAAALERSIADHAVRLRGHDRGHRSRQLQSRQRPRGSRRRGPAAHRGDLGLACRNSPRRPARTLRGRRVRDAALGHRPFSRCKP